ncbi:MAG: pantoate--beta-alanine ligase [Actinomycetota bacterium]|nr:pantoate--beta-alanine ligase [Actinomycetota bacterium]
MELIRGADELSWTTRSWRTDAFEVGLVPTMGSLHEGHASLIRRARDEAARVVVSIFINPAQFGPDEDLLTYPRDEERDLEICRRLGVDAVWAPPEEEVYPPGEALPEPDPGPVGETFEGAARPGHFRGVLKVVHRLLDLTGPCRVYLGEKDAQQLFLVRRMVGEMRLPVTVVPCPTAREPDGLAYSSRNALLGAEEREQAGCLFLALSEAAALARAGETDAAILVAAMGREIGATPLARLDHAAVVRDDTFEATTRLGGLTRAIVAARFPSARLIDNLRLPQAAKES